MTPAARHLVNMLERARLNMASEDVLRFGVEPLEEIAFFIHDNIPYIVGSGPVNLMEHLQIVITAPPRRRNERLTPLAQLVDYYNYLVISAELYLNMRPGQNYETFR